MPKFKDTKPQNVRPGFKGEKHPPMKMGTLNFKKGNFLGPGTNFVARINRGDRPINYSDKVAMAHDARYSVSKNPKDVRRADLIMVDSLSKGIKQKKDFPINMRVSRLGIRGKVALERLNIAGPTTFTTPGQINPKDRPKVQRVLNGLKRQGFGETKRKSKKDLFETAKGFR